MAEAAVPTMIFDPGIGSDDLLEDVLAAIGKRGEKVKSITDGTLVVDSNVVRVSMILFDSGALHRSYINKGLVDSNRETWGNKITKARSAVRLADQKTIKESSEELEASLTVTLDDGISQRADLNLVVWDMPGLDLIIGLPDITKFFKDKFVEMLGVTTEMEPGEVILWYDGVQEESEEELLTETPCSFTEALNFMEVTYEEE